MSCCDRLISLSTVSSRAIDGVAGVRVPPFGGFVSAHHRWVLGCPALVAVNAAEGDVWGADIS